MAGKFGSGGQTWFTSDTHFGHKNIVRGCSNWSEKSACRDFHTVEEHDEYLLAQINKMVRPQDTLYHLGDFGLGCGARARFPELRRRIRCETIHLLIGNHDHAIEDKRNGNMRTLFKRVKYLHFGKIAGRFMCLCHYAMKTWPWQHQLSVHLYGHSHGNLPDDPNSLSLDVGVDTSWFGHTRYTPYSADEVFAIMDQNKQFTPIDHHAGPNNS